MTLPEPTTDFKLLATASSYLRKDFEEGYTEWLNSPFEWILHLPAGSKGKLGKHLIYQWCALKGLSVDRCTDSEADMLINGHRVEVKFSTLWKSGIYKFQQIRDQNYEYSVCLGISPFEAHCWVLSKAVLKRYVIGHLGQHTGNEGKETAWITVDPKNPLDWIRPYGGTLEQAFVVLRNLSHRK
ncbi:MAG TPA: hypothetical protein VKF38_13670 [Anaerolineaceae bacterium]|nr:hypothetical protein [Anaerolineaceae bacterium]